MMSVPYWYKHGHILEPELFAKSDIVTANSTYLADIAKNIIQIVFMLDKVAKLKPLIYQK